MNPTAVGGRTGKRVLLSFVNWRFRSLRGALEGQPVVLVENGKLLDGT